MGSSQFKSGMSRRHVVIAAVAAAPILALSPTIAEAKLAQTSVGYQDSPKDDKQCGQCNFFISPNACKLVDGEISQAGYCKLWAKKTG